MKVITLEKEDVILNAILTELRNVDTSKSRFRQLCRMLVPHLVHDALTNFSEYLNPMAKLVSTPVQGQEYLGTIFKPEPMNVISILRSGNILLPSVVEFLDDNFSNNCSVGYLGIERDHNDSRQQIVEYGKIPEELEIQDSNSLLCEPMIATGGSAIAGAKILREAGVKRIVILAIIVSTEGIEALKESQLIDGLVTYAIDPALNEAGYITPGLGDAGDRACGKWNKKIWNNFHHYGKIAVGAGAP